MTARTLILLATTFAFRLSPLPAQPPREVILATTTSLHETGILDSLAPLFLRASGYALRPIAVGSGQALKMAERGDADVALVHSPAAEEAFMRAGHGLTRRPVAENYFTIAGPPDDPAGVRSAASAAEALRRIAAREAAFISRGDSSGTHARELVLWRQTGGLAVWSGYAESGQGMAPTLLIAEERQAYTLTDRSSLAGLRHRLTLVALREPEPALRNVYSVIELRPAGRPRLNVEGGRAFATFITSEPARALLERFGFNRPR